MIVRSLQATYRVTSEQNPSGIVISEPNKIKKWVVEKFDGISPGLLVTDFQINFRCIDPDHVNHLNDFRGNIEKNWEFHLP